MKIKNIALAISLVSFAVGYSDFQENIVFWMARPVSAIFAVVYFICLFIEGFERSDAPETTAAKASAKNVDAKELDVRGLTPLSR